MNSLPIPTSVMFKGLSSIKGLDAFGTVQNYLGGLIAVHLQSPSILEGMRAISSLKDVTLVNIQSQLTHANTNRWLVTVQCHCTAPDELCLNHIPHVGMEKKYPGNPNDAINQDIDNVKSINVVTDTRTCCDWKGSCKLAVKSYDQVYFYVYDRTGNQFRIPRDCAVSYNV